MFTYIHIEIKMSKIFRIASGKIKVFEGGTKFILPL